MTVPASSLTCPLPLPRLGGVRATWWVTEGRITEILDNLLAQGKAVPMIVVVPEANALTFETAETGSAVNSGPDFYVSLGKIRWR